MTMDYKVDEDVMLHKLKPGDEILATHCTRTITRSTTSKSKIEDRLKRPQ